jgi:hypothetical protein
MWDEGDVVAGEDGEAEAANEVETHHLPTMCAVSRR